MSYVTACAPLGTPCTHSCHMASTTAIGFNLVRSDTGGGPAYLNPSASSATWQLRRAPPLLSPPAGFPAYLPGILTGALNNARPWAATLVGELLSLSAWLQISLLSGYSKKTTTRAVHSLHQPQRLHMHCPIPAYNARPPHHAPLLSLDFPSNVAHRACALDGSVVRQLDFGTKAIA